MVTVQFLAVQQRGHRLADDVRAADHHRILPRQDRPADPRAASGSRAACRARSPAARSASRPALTRWKPSTSLSGSIAVSTSWASICAGSGSWTRMPSTAGSALSWSTSASSVALVGVGGQLVLEALHARLAGLLALVADIDRARPDPRRPAPRRARARARSLSRNAGTSSATPGPEARRECLAVDECSAHALRP